MKHCKPHEKSRIKASSSMLLQIMKATPAEEQAARQVADSILAFEHWLTHPEVEQDYDVPRPEAHIEALGLGWRREAELGSVALRIAEETRGGPPVTTNMRRNDSSRPKTMGRNGGGFKPERLITQTQGAT